MKKLFLLVLLVTVLVAVGATTAEAGNKVQVCHIPNNPNNAANFHTLTVSENALSSHLAHGDLPGNCDDNCDALCDDADACTIDHNMDCEAQGCLAVSQPVDCDDGLHCTTDSCDAVDGCQYAPIVCDDGDNCTVDACNPMNGQCVGTPIDCDPLGVCVAATGLCDFPCNGFTCDPIDQCHAAGTCVLDMAGAPLCLDGPALADEIPCDDGDGCLVNDTCQSGVCQGSTPIVCVASDQCHVAGTCDPQSGDCSNPPAQDSTPCDDDNACTQTDACQAGTCTGTNPVTCSASDQCHDAGTCDTETGICSDPAKADGTACNDVNACTHLDSCVAGACVGADPVDCAASDQCHDAGTCDPGTGQCSSPVTADGTPCDDGDGGTENDLCTSGVCAGTNTNGCPPSQEVQCGPAFGNKCIFATREKWGGGMVGPNIEGASAKCAAAAAAAGLPGEFKAFIADWFFTDNWWWSSAYPSLSPPSTEPYAQTDGRVIAANWDDLSLTTTRVDPIDEYGVTCPGGSFAWTGRIKRNKTSVNSPGGVCHLGADRAWENTQSISSNIGGKGCWSTTWMGCGSETCNKLGHLICVEQ